MSTKRAAILIIGVVVCVPLLALYHRGLFGDLAGWLERTYRQVFVLREEHLARVVPLQYAYYTFMAFFSAWVCAEMPRQSRKFGFIFGAVFLTLILSPALAFNGVLFEPLSGAAAVIGAGFLGILISGTERGQRAHFLRRFFIGRISEGAFVQLVGAKELPKLTGRRELTVLSCRVLNYAELGTELEAEEMEKLSSGFLKAVAEFLVSKGAYLDSCNEDGVRVLFGFPLADEQHAATACRVALELRVRLVNLAQEMENRWHKRPALGVALASGDMTCGLFGFSEFQFYGAVGESLEFSQRLCAINAIYGSHVLLSNRTFHLAEGAIEVRPMEMVFAPKIHAVSEVYELLSGKGALTEDEAKARDAFWQGVVHLRKADYKAALESFNQSRIEGREDAPLRYFSDRAEAGAREDASTVDQQGSARHVRLLMGG
ncbi:MAG: adenylate/guanylate cyclase domain-containing protein [Verrucomicrobiaceae bacterium]|nr:adenylate/guanylate cyclase domain-containing protein [Verrucomicrobiaceae bacterium]